MDSGQVGVAFGYHRALKLCILRLGFDSFL